MVGDVSSLHIRGRKFTVTHDVQYIGSRAGIVAMVAILTEHSGAILLRLDGRMDRPLSTA